jgi:hypothetical protein
VMTVACLAGGFAGVMLGQRWVGTSSSCRERRIGGEFWTASRSCSNLHRGVGSLASPAPLAGAFGAGPSRRPRGRDGISGDRRFRRP